MVFIVAVTGTPGTGKTVLSRKLAKDAGFVHIDLNVEIRKRKLHEGKDVSRDTLVVDESKLSAFLDDILPEKVSGAVVDSHMSHFLPKALVDVCVIVHAKLSTIKRRLHKRNYSGKKIRENLDAEIFNICGEEAKERGLSTITVNSPLSADEYRSLLMRIQRTLAA